MEHIIEFMKKCCPICRNEELILKLHTKDYFLSQEEFNLLQCANCDIIFTDPFPLPEQLGSYYDSGEYFSHGGIQKGLIPKIYNSVKKINIRKKYEQVTKDLRQGRVLDIGCGIGDFLAHCKSKGWEVSGLEPNEQARKIVLNSHNITVKDISEIGEIPNEQFELITMFHVLEHVTEPKKMILEIMRILKPGGRLVIALPNYDSWDAKHYKKYWAAWDVPRHLFHFNPSSLSIFMKEFPLKRENTKPMFWDAFYVSLLSEKYKSKSVPLLRAGIKGFYSNILASRNGNFSSLIYFFSKPLQ